MPAIGLPSWKVTLKYNGQPYEYRVAALIYSAAVSAAKNKLAKQLGISKEEASKAVTMICVKV